MGWDGNQDDGTNDGTENIYTGGVLAYVGLSEYSPLSARPIHSLSFSLKSIQLSCLCSP